MVHRKFGIQFLLACMCPSTETFKSKLTCTPVLGDNKAYVIGQTSQKYLHNLKKKKGILLEKGGGGQANL